MLKGKEVFKVVKTIEQIIDTKANIISKEQKVDRDDARSIIYLTTIDFFRKFYDNKRSKPITFFLNFCLPRAKTEIIRQMHPLKLSYDSIEKGTYKKFSFTSLDCRVGDADDNDLYDLYTPYEDNTIELFDIKTYGNKLLNKSKLTAKEKKVIKMYFGLYNDKQYTLKEIGKAYNICHETARRIKDTGIKKIKTYNRIGDY